MDRPERQNSRTSDKRENFRLAVPAAPISLSAFGVSVSENFDSLSNTAGSTTNVLTIPGWELTESGLGARDNEQYAVDTGGSSTGDTFSYGSAGSTERALGGVRSGTLFTIFGASFQNNTGSTVSDLNISYTGEEWRYGAPSRGPDRIDFQYSLDATSLTTGTWTDVDGLDFSTPNLTGLGGLRDGNAALNRTAIAQTIGGLTLTNGSTIWIRWVDVDATNSDDGLAIDDFSITPLAPTAAPALISGRVTTAEGFGLRNATVTVQGGSIEGVRTAMTTTFGYYRIDGLTAGMTYIVSVGSRRYVFANGTRIVNLTENVTGLDFIAEP